MEKLKIYLEEQAIMPERGHSTDAGLDIKSPYPFTLPAKGSVIINTGVHFSIPAGWVGFAKSKSGLNVNHGIQCEGVIDAGFTGPLVIKLHNLSSEDYYIKPKDKVAQIVFLPIATPELKLVPFEEIEKESALISTRGQSGWGSTGR